MEMSKIMEEMLNFLRHSKPTNPLNLDAAYDLGNKANLKAYSDYLKLAQLGLINENKGGVWITDQGLKKLEEIGAKYLKQNPLA